MSQKKTQVHGSEPGLSHEADASAWSSIPLKSPSAAAGSAGDIESHSDSNKGKSPQPRSEPRRHDPRVQELISRWETLPVEDSSKGPGASASPAVPAKRVSTAHWFLSQKEADERARQKRELAKWKPPKHLTQTSLQERAAVFVSYVGELVAGSGSKMNPFSRRDSAIPTSHWDSKALMKLKEQGQTAEGEDEDEENQEEREGGNDDWVQMESNEETNEEEEEEDWSEVPSCPYEEVYPRQKSRQEAIMDSVDAAHARVVEHTKSVGKAFNPKSWTF